jgi:uncharacterized protein (DUF779 family)
MDRLGMTDEAKEVVDELRSVNGPLIFHQSGGCCDGSSPMCFADGEFMIGSRDVCLGEVHGCRFYMASDQFKYYENMHITIDVVVGRGASFSLEIPLGVRFVSVSRLFTEQELALLAPVQ